MKTIRLAKALLRKNAWFVGLFQALLTFFSLALAWFLRFDFSLPDRRILFPAIILLIAIRMMTIAQFGLLHGWWRYTGLRDGLDVVKAVISSSIAFTLVERYLLQVKSFPRAVFLLEPVLAAVMLIGVRIFSRVLAESVRQDLTSSKKVLLLGAGIGALSVVRELRQPGSQYSAVGYVDDDPSKLGLKFEGIPVLGTVDQIPVLAESYSFDEILIAVPSATSQQMQRFVEICGRTGLRFRTVPALHDVIAERASISAFREVDVEDLLGRDPVKIDLLSVRSAIAGRAVLVTGAAGSIGSELCRQIAAYHPRILACVDRDETGMFYLRHELTNLKGDVDVRCRVSDVTDSKEMDHVFREISPDTIFHAAAYKHVPLMEVNVSAATQNNVFGLLNLLDVAARYESKTFIFISSDKAVNPSSVMGATKRIGELIIANRPSNGMRCLSVRFGNVLGSKGSIVPVLQQQLQRNEVLTVTHPDMKRFFMTIREAVSLVLQASVIGERSDTLVLDMGPPVPIMQLVQTLIRLSGQSSKQVLIKFIGLREGEKLVEELFYASEEVDETSFKKIKRARGSREHWDGIAMKLDELEASLFLNGSESVRAKIRDLVPEYVPPADQTQPDVAFADCSGETQTAAHHATV